MISDNCFKLSDTKITALGYIVTSPRPKALINMSLLEITPVWIRDTPDNLKTREMCNEAMRIDPYSLTIVPDCLKTQKCVIRPLK